MKKIIASLAILTAAALLSQRAGAQEEWTARGIGAAACPAEIAAIEAPFEMPALQRPVFADRSLDIKARGARQGRKCTAVIQKCIDQLSAKGGGKVIIPAGDWLTGRLILKSGVCLHLEEGAVLRFTGEVEDYLPAVFTRSEGIEIYSTGACIYARDAENIGITGKGTLVGPPQGSPVQTLNMSGVVVEKFVDYNSPVESRVYDTIHNTDGLEHGARTPNPLFSPLFFSPVDCKNVLVEGVRFQDSIFWNIVPIYCDGVIIRGVTVDSRGGRTDGIDIDSSQNVLIEYVTLGCGDDCFTIKAGRCEDGIRVNRPTANVVIRHCLALRGPGGLTCGSETAGWIRNVYCYDCAFLNVSNGFYFKTRRTRGGGVENVWVDGIVMQGVKNAFGWDMLGSRTYVGELADRFPVREIGPLTPAFRQIHISNVDIESCRTLFSIKAIPEIPLEGLYIKNMNATCSQMGSMQDVGLITFDNCNIRTVQQ